MSLGHPRILAICSLLLFGAVLTFLSSSAPPTAASPKTAKLGAGASPIPDQNFAPEAHCSPDWQSWYVPYLTGARFELRDVVAVSPTELWAVGTRFDWPYEPLIMRWDGSAWSQVPGPHLQGAGTLWSVAATSRNDVWAVGYYDIGNRRWQPLVLHWDGSAWTRIPTPTVGSGSSHLFGVTALSPDDIWAVGSVCCNLYNVETLTMHWDGNAWTVVPSRSVPSANNTLSSVSAVAPDDIWAVGAYGAYDNRQTLIEHWDGTQWSIVNLAKGAVPGGLLAVEALSGSDGWAVGYTGSAYYRRTLIMRWNGVAWEVAPSPSPGDQDNVLSGLAAVSPDDIWAVGSYRNNYAQDETLIVHWDGGRWTQVPSPNNSYAANNFYGLEVVSPGDIWAVGKTSYYYETSQPFIARYAGRVGFQDVIPSDYFYEPVRYLYCKNVVSGYADNTFRPNNNTTRAQLSKIVVLAQEWPLVNPGDHTFADVLPGTTFYQYVETAASRGIIGGYPCGQAMHEPCDAQRRPYFRPNAEVTRAQVTKIVVLARSWPLLNPPRPTFSDVPSGSLFYRYVETAVAHSIIDGYADGTFRPANSATRGQIAKIVYNAITSP